MNLEGVEPGPGANGPSVEDTGPPRSHRRGMLAGLGVIGLLLAGLLLFGPGGTGPRPAERSQGGQSPVTIPVASNAATAGSTTTTTTVPPAPTPKTGPVTDLAASTYQVRGPTPAGASTPTSVPAHGPTTTVPPSAPAATTTTTTAPAPPLTTTTTSPTVTTTTSCVLFLCD